MIIHEQFMFTVYLKTYFQQQARYTRWLAENIIQCGYWYLPNAGCFTWMSIVHNTAQNLSKMAGVDEEVVPESQENEVLQEKGDAETTEQSGHDRLIKLPLSRVKHIMKCDPDVTLASQEAVVALAKATELFVHMLSKDASGNTMQGKRKTLQRKDLDHVMERRDCYLFLDGALD